MCTRPRMVLANQVGNDYQDLQLDYKNRNVRFRIRIRVLECWIGLRFGGNVGEEKSLGCHYYHSKTPCRLQKRPKCIIRALEFPKPKHSSQFVLLQPSSNSLEFRQLDTRKHNTKTDPTIDLSSDLPNLDLQREPHCRGKTWRKVVIIIVNFLPQCNFFLSWCSCEQY